MSEDDANEAARDPVAREQEHGGAYISLALIEGERSGEPQPFDFTAFKRRKIAQHG